MVWLGQEESEDLLVLRRLLQPGQTFVDCGANIGLWSLVAAKAVQPTGKVLAFEPNPLIHVRLMQNVERNELTRTVVAFQACCGSQSGTLRFRCEREHNVSRVALEGENGVLLPVVTLDSTIQDAAVHGLKIDVEGHELAVLHGAKRLLERTKPWICVEFNSALARIARLGDWDVHRFLRATGYRCRRLVDEVAQTELSEEWELNGYTNIFYWRDER
jgi:FkbM family methyltransferase